MLHFATFTLANVANLLNIFFNERTTVMSQYLGSGSSSCGISHKWFGLITSNRTIG